MSTLRITNIEAKADASSPSVDEKVKIVNSSGQTLLQVDGATSGVATVTVGTGVTIQGDTGVIKATSFTGSGANLTGIDSTVLKDTGGNVKIRSNTSGAVITGVLTATSINVEGALTYQDVTNVDSVGVVTARTNLFVGAGVSCYGSTGIVSATSFYGDVSNCTGAGVGSNDNVNTSGIVTAKAFIPSSGQLGHRNILVNGAMNVAQRGTSSNSGGFQTVDRWQVSDNNTNTTITQSRHALTSSDTGPWELGFRNSYYIDLSGAGNSLAGDSCLELVYGIEAQDLAFSGWDYTNPNSFITISFWLKVSANQTFYGHLRTKDGTEQGYPFSFTASGNNTWTKITQSIPGYANLQFDNNENIGCQLRLVPYYASGFTDSGRADKTWAAHSSGTFTPDMATTWITTSGAVFEYTGIQLEVGSVATPFEHISYGEDVKRCQRYFFSPSGSFPMFADRTTDAHNCGRTGMYWFNQPMRSSPTMSNMTMSVYTGSAQTLQAYSVTPDFCWFNHTGSFSDGRAWCKINSFKADAEI